MSIEEQKAAQSVWNKPNELPPVAVGHQGWFWVAVRRAHNGKVYSFPATYLNNMLLSNEFGDHEARSGNHYSYGPLDEDEGCFPATGWHDAQEHGEYDCMYSPLLTEDDDELVAWRAVPDYGSPDDLQATTQPAGYTHEDVMRLVEAASRANGEHSAPHDCYATGPLTGDFVRDLVLCPGCELVDALAPFAHQAKDGSR